MANIKSHLVVVDQPHSHEKYVVAKCECSKHWRPPPTQGIAARPRLRLSTERIITQPSAPTCTLLRYQVVNQSTGEKQMRSFKPSYEAPARRAFGLPMVVAYAKHACHAGRAGDSA